jgi:hypothetical protein
VQPKKFGNNADKNQAIPEADPSLAERIEMLVTAVGGNSKAAKIAGVSTDTILNWKKAGSRLPLQEMLALAKEAGVTLDWIATGHDRRPDMSPPEQAGEDFVRIAVYGATAEDTLGELRFQPPTAFWRNWMNEASLVPESCALVMAQDDAMAPEISPGDMLLVDRTQQEMNKSGVYALLRRNAVLVRRVHVMVNGGAQLIPTNAQYEKEKLAAEAATNLIVAGRVRAVFKFID